MAEIAGAILLILLGIVIGAVLVCAAIGNVVR